MTSSGDAEFDPYAALGVRAGSTYDDIRKAYRRKVLAAHPDRRSKEATSGCGGNGAGAESSEAASFHRVQRAWEILRVRAEREERSSTLAAVQLSAYKQDATDELDLEEDMEWDGERECFFLVEGCRCGGSVEVSSAQLDEDAAEGLSVVVCNGCSLEYSILFDLDEEECEEGEASAAEEAQTEREAEVQKQGAA